MAHFAQIDNQNVVTQVIVISNADAPDETTGQAFIASLGIQGVWRQTSYNATFRAHYAGIGYTYHDQADVFYPAQPYPSWTLDNEWNWQPPTPYPDDGNPYVWNEDTQQWQSEPPPSTT